MKVQAWGAGFLQRELLHTDTDFVGLLLHSTANGQLRVAQYAADNGSEEMRSLHVWYQQRLHSLPPMSGIVYVDRHRDGNQHRARSSMLALGFG